jgi:glycosyltransferase involved in cell wall biosynthesis
MFPGAVVACLVRNPHFKPKWLSDVKIVTSPLQKLPLAYRYYKELLPLQPWAISRLRVDCKFLLSSDAAMTKGLPLPADTRQVCYCHSPPRYLWDQMHNYLGKKPIVANVKKVGLSIIRGKCRRFDLESSRKVDSFIANSSFVAERIRRIYGRQSHVVFPPVNVDRFSVSPNTSGFYLIVSQLVPYKRVDLAIDAFNRLGLPLHIVGDGESKNELKLRARPNIVFLGRLSDLEVCRQIEQCKAFLYPQVEDFGITAVEAQAAGKPVIALRAGGALETVIEGVTGIFFNDQNWRALMDAVVLFEKGLVRFSAQACRSNAEKFDASHFRAEIGGLISDYIAGLGN